MIDLTPERGLIFRITHVENVPWLLANGLHCATSAVRDPNFVQIGNADLINRRRSRHIPHAIGGTLSDYVPFYFTPASPMFLNIKTGWGVPKRRNDEIAVLVSSIYHLQEQNVPFVFSDRHAVLAAAQFTNDHNRLVDLPWQQLRAKDFKKDPDDPEKVERYQAEALIRTHMPASALLGIGCANQLAANGLAAIVAEVGVNIRVVSRPQWYF